MKQLLASIVFAIAIFAGFTARAEAAYDTKIWYDKVGRFVWCGLDKTADKDDITISYRGYANHPTCEASKEYKDFAKKYDGNDLVPIDVGRWTDVDELPDVIVPKLTKIQKYIKIFEAKTGISASHIKFSLGITKGKAVGTCSMKSRHILISKKYWEGDTSEYDKELTIYHELGHCLLNRAHYNPLNKTFWSKPLQKNCPISIMYWKSYGSKDAYRCFHDNRDYYWRELVVGTFAIKAKKQGAKDLLFDYYITSGIQNFKAGAFSCAVYTAKEQPEFYKDHGQVWFYVNLSCSRDKVIHTRNFRFFVQSVGNDAVDNLTAKAQNQVPMRFILEDKILNEVFTVELYKDSGDLW